MCDYLLSLLCELQKGKCVGQDRSGLFFSNKLLQNISGLIEKKKKKMIYHTVCPACGSGKSPSIQLHEIPADKGSTVELHHLEQPSWLSRKGKRNRESNEPALLCFGLPSTHRSLAELTTWSCLTPGRLINAAEQIKYRVHTIFSVNEKILEGPIIVYLYPHSVKHSAVYMENSQ